MDVLFDSRSDIEALGDTVRESEKAMPLTGGYRRSRSRAVVNSVKANEQRTRNRPSMPLFKCLGE